MSVPETRLQPEGSSAVTISPEAETILGAPLSVSPEPPQAGKASSTAAVKRSQRAFFIASNPFFMASSIQQARTGFH